MRTSLNINSRTALSCFLYITIAILPILDLNLITTRILTPIALFYSIFSSKYNFKKASIPSLKYFGLFILWSLIPATLSHFPEISWEVSLRMFAIFAYIYSISEISMRSKENLISALQAISLGCATVFIHFFITTMGMDYSSNVQREFTLNANTYGYYGFIGSSSLFLLSTMRPSALKQAIYTISFIMCYCIVSIFTASRGGFIISIIFALSYFILLSNNNVGRFRVLYIIASPILLFAIGYVLIKLYNSSLLSSRFDQAMATTNPRAGHVEEAWRIFLENPLFGIGGGSYSMQFRSFELGAFTHNGFLEAAVSFGIVGFTAYSMIIIEYLLTSIKRKSRGLLSKRDFRIHILILIGFTLYNFLYVPYLTFEFMTIIVISRACLNMITKPNIDFTFKFGAVQRSLSLR